MSGSEKRDRRAHGKGAVNDTKTVSRHACLSRTIPAWCRDVLVAWCRTIFVEGTVRPSPDTTLPGWTDDEGHGHADSEFETASARPLAGLGTNAGPYCLGTVVGHS
jgi:hypothetical protein